MDDLRRWRKEYARTVERVDELRGLKRGHVGIALIDALSQGIVARMITEVGEEYPRLTFDIRVMDNRDVAEQVNASEVDLGILLEPVENANLALRAIVEIPIGIAVPVGHALTRQSRVSLSHILDYRQILPAPPLIVHQRAVALYARHRAEYQQFVACNNVKMMRSLVRSAAGIGILSFIDVAADVEEGRLAFVPLQGRQTKPLALALCVAPRRQLSRAAQLVIERVAISLKALA